MGGAVKTAGILTLCWGRNYGGVLQSYALQEVISELGFECSVINFRDSSRYIDRTSKRGAAYVVWRLATSVCDFFCRFTVDRLQVGARETKYLEFFTDKINFTKEIYTSENDLKKTPPDVDAFIVGSDVVWYPREEGHFLLSFVPQESRRISYAASFGLDDVPERLRRHMGEGISKFDYISVRENRGVEIVKELTGRHAEWVVDPTLLMTAERWKEMATPPNNEKPYILTYFLNQSAYMQKVAHFVQKQTGHRIVNIAGGNWEFQNPRRKLYEYFVQCMDWKMKSCYDVGPSEFVGLFENASCVITNSFHGMIFAIIFQKPFFSILRRGMGVRQRSFAEMLGVGHGVLTEGDSLPDLSAMNQDYSAIGECLAQLRSKSSAFLKNSLSAEVQPS
jgi:hypothetical protein